MPGTAVWGMLIGWIFFVPSSAPLGRGDGGIRASWSDYGIGKDFIENVRGKVTEGTSALFLLVGQVTEDRVVEAFKARAV